MGIDLETLSAKVSDYCIQAYQLEGMANAGEIDSAALKPMEEDGSYPRQDDRIVDAFVATHQTQEPSPEPTAPAPDINHIPGMTS